MSHFDRCRARRRRGPDICDRIGRGNSACSGAGSFHRDMEMRRVQRTAGVVVLLLALGALIGFLAASWWFPKVWRDLLVVEAPMTTADAIVLLGGESQGRPVEAARLYHLGVARRVVVVGTGDNVSNRRILRNAGVPVEAILTEPSSSSTLENAIFVRPILEQAGIRKALLVTSSFHARRALATFQQRIPDVSFGVSTSRIGWWDTPQGRPQEDSWAAKEFVKIAYYWIVHGIVPWIDKRPVES